MPLHHPAYLVQCVTISSLLTLEICFFNFVGMAGNSKMKRPAATGTVKGKEDKGTSSGSAGAGPGPCEADDGGAESEEKEEKNNEASKVNTKGKKKKTNRYAKKWEISLGPRVQLFFLPWEYIDKFSGNFASRAIARSICKDKTNGFGLDESVSCCLGLLHNIQVISLCVP